METVSIIEAIAAAKQDQHVRPVSWADDPDQQEFYIAVIDYDDSIARLETELDFGYRHEFTSAEIMGEWEIIEP